MLDRPRVRALLDRLRTETAGLRDLATYSEADLLGGRHELAAAKYRFISPSRPASISPNTSSPRKACAPDSLADAFAVLGEANLLPPELVPTLQSMARFRNLLVHHYADVDDHRVVEILHTSLGDFDRFIAEAARLALK